MVKGFKLISDAVTFFFAANKCLLKRTQCTYFTCTNHNALISSRCTHKWKLNYIQLKCESGKLRIIQIYADLINNLVIYNTLINFG